VAVKSEEISTLIEQTPIWHFHKHFRNADEGEPTRRKLLEAAFEEVHHMGFQATSLSRILKRTTVTKGAFCYAVIKEAIRIAVLNSGPNRYHAERRHTRNPKQLIKFRWVTKATHLLANTTTSIALSQHPIHGLGSSNLELRPSAFCSVVAK
jgi:hypothetical protein